MNHAPQDWVTTGGLIAATLMSIAACIAAALRLRRPQSGSPIAERAAIALATLICATVFIYRALCVHRSWVPLQSHVDGLLLLAALIGITVMWSQWTGRLPGLGVFLLPVMAMASLWGVCASWWTWRPFDIGGLWLSLHLLSVYVGSLAIAAAAAAGALWLFVDRQLRAPDDRARRLKVLGSLANLESIERAIVRSATVGFVLITIGLVSGLVVVTGEPTKLGTGWWYSPKVVLATVVWVIFAVVMHVRFVPTFRGRRAAVLSIIGLALMIVVLGLAQALPEISMQGRANPSPLRERLGEGEARQIAGSDHEADAARTAAALTLTPTLSLAGRGSHRLVEAR